MLDLNTQQVVLLCLLVSFVTSIATGITTVALLERAPDPVTQTINRVVERTIERVVSDDTDKNTNKVTVRETPERIIETVVVKEEDLTIESVEKNSPSIARIYYLNGAEEVFLGLGLIVNPKGRIVTDKIVYNSYRQNIFARINGTDYSLTYVEDANSPLLAMYDMENDSDINFNPANFGDSQSIQLGQTVISLSGKLNDTVSTGIINSFQTVENGETENISGIITSVNPANVMNGSILLNLKGVIVGMKINSYSPDPTTFIPSNAIEAFIGINQI